MKATRSLDNSEVNSFFYLLLQKVILYSWILYCAVDMSAGICWLTWLSCLLIFTCNLIISNKAWSTCWLDSRRPICWDIYKYRPVGDLLKSWVHGCWIQAFSSQDPRNLWLCLVCLVNNFDLPLWSRMYTPNWSLRHCMKKKTKVTNICQNISTSKLVSCLIDL